ncbi:MAG: hypothetical protein NC433_04070 [Clostridiales bacterium]|nr:hypothetical protein [Clostridiales bacterium]
MVNRIDDKNYYTYTKTKNINVSNNGEKFNLNYNNEELQTKDSEKKDKAGESEKGKAAESGVKLELSNSGKNAAADRGKATETKAQATENQQSIFGMLRELVSTVVSAVKDIFYKIWNDPEPKMDAAAADNGTETEIDNLTVSNGTAETELLTAEDGMAEGAEADALAVSDGITAGTERFAAKNETQDFEETYASHKSAQARLDREIQPYLRKGDLNQVISLLTDNGKKTVAINSTLLTYYDRNGKMVELNASDRERILRGDRNTKKL